MSLAVADTTVLSNFAQLSKPGLIAEAFPGVAASGRDAADDDVPYVMRLKGFEYGL